MGCNFAGVLAAVGDVFLVDTLVFVNGDHAEKRPVVVVRAPKHDLDYMTVVQRSSTVRDRRGVDHPRDPDLGLDKDGRWILDYARTVRADQFLGGAEYRGRLASRWLEPLIAAWETL